MADGENQSEEGAGEKTAEELEEAKVDEETKVAEEKAAKEGASKNEEDEVFTDAKGNEFVPRKAFEARVGKLTARAKENEEAAELLKTLNEDPDAQRLWMEQHSLNKPVNAPKIDDYISKWGPYMEKLPKESQEAMRRFEEAIGPDIQHQIKKEVDKVRSEYQEQMTPLRAALGEQTLKEFYKAVPEAKQYEKHIHKLMEANSNLGLEDAFGAAAYKDAFKKGRDAQIKNATERNIKITKNPISKSGSGKQVKGSGKMGIEEGIMAALNDTELQ